MKKNIKKMYAILIILIFTVVIISVIDIYLKKVKNENSIGDKAIETDTTKEETSKDLLSSSATVLENYDKLFEWYDGKSPKVTTYDTLKQKSREYLAYGISTDEYDYLKKCYDEDVEHNVENPLSGEYEGHGKYSKNNVLIGSEIFSRKYMSGFGFFCSTEFCDKFTIDIVDDYFMENTRDMIINNLSDDRSCINNMKVYNSETGELCDNQKIYYAMVQVSFKSNSIWVNDVLIAPKLRYLNDDGDILSEYNSPVYISVNGEKLTKSEYGIYIDSRADNGTTFYDYNDVLCRNSVPQCHCPLRIGESVNCLIIYLIPEENLQDAYLVYNDLEEYEEVNYTYNLLNVAIYDLYKEFEAYK